MRWVRVGLFAWSCIACALVGTNAEAQPKSGGPQKQTNSQFTLRHEEVGGAEGVKARERARAGDCAAALPAFDAALRSGIDPTLRRDRGLCHEKVGNPFPAIDDYRAYLTARPDAPDAEQIRERLGALEQQVGTQSSQLEKSEAASEGAAMGTSASASVSVGASGASATSSAKEGSLTQKSTRTAILGPKPGEPPQTYDFYVQQEKLVDAAEASPLRYGTGVVLGPIVHMPRFFVGDGARAGALAYGVALALRYSLGSSASLISEIGYAGIGTSGATSSQNGPLLMGGVEIRVPLTRYASDQLLVRGGFGYERYVVSGTRAILTNLLGRFAFGYRHVWGPSLALEFLADGGPAYVIPESGSGRVNGVVGGSVAFVVGF